jgi:ATP-dependent exoDNAse (exonuclease V) beta subunit
VLRAAHDIIKHNYAQGECFEVLNAQGREGKPVRIVKLNDAKAEAVFVANHIESTNTPLNETLILYRSHAQAKEIISELKRRNIPFNTVSTKDLLLRDDIKKIIAYLQVIAKGAHHKQSWWVLLGDLNLEEEDLAILLKKNKKEDLEDFLRTLPLKNQEKQKELQSLLSRIDILREEKDLLKLIEQVIEFIGVGHHEESLINIKRFEDLARHFINIEHKGVKSFVSYLENLEKVGANLKEQKLESPGAVKLLTMHAAKGLEAQDVYLIGWNESFPNLKSTREPFIPTSIHPFYKDCIDEKDLAKRKKEIRLEEERRLAYVAITRAKDSLIITCPGSTSRFIEDLNLQVEEVDIVVPTHTKQVKAVKHEMPYFSFSNLLTYKTCPKKFELQEIYRMQPAFYNESAARGSFFHGVIEKISKARLEGKHLSVDEAIEKQNQEQETQYTYEDIKAWYEVWKRRNTLEYLQQVEKPFLFDEDGLKFTGFIDRIDATPQGYTIIDYKTGKQKTTGEKLQWQLSLYAMSLIKNNKKIHRLIVDELNHEHPTSFILKDDGTAIDEIGRQYAFNIKQVFNRMKTLAKEIKKDQHFLPVEDDTPCRTCPFKLYCPKWAD